MCVIVYMYYVYVYICAEPGGMAVCSVPWYQSFVGLNLNPL